MDISKVLTNSYHPHQVHCYDYMQKYVKYRPHRYHRRYSNEITSIKKIFFFSKVGSRPLHNRKFVVHKPPSQQQETNKCLQ
jgi:hypothetical protein